MEPQFQTSFIPKKPLEASMPGKPIHQAHPSGILSIIITVLFVLSLLSAGGVFAYGKFITNDLANKEAVLSEAIKSIENDANMYIKLNEKISTVKNLLSGRHFLSRVFFTLESKLFRDVWFADFKYSESEKASIVTINGKARSFAAIAAQSDEFAKTGFLKNFSFYNFSLGDNGLVNFTFKSEINWLDTELKDQAVAVPQS
ncbi:MAG: PilN domain-containing protein [Candidatus Paceibacterota bacterium]|jgi:hypothetical protein